MQKPSVFVIILNYNGKDTLLECLSSVYRSDYANMSVVVVDNASDDGSFENARERFSTAHFIRNSANLGFSKGNNMGIRFALEKFADYVFLLNNDAEVFPDTISLLLEAAQKNKSCGIISPLILKPEGSKIWFAGGKIDYLKMRCLHEFLVQSKDAYTSEYISGCAMLIKKEVFQKIGIFDEHFFLYYEDADFSVRAKRNNFDLLVFPGAKVLHRETSNDKNSQKTYYLVLSALIFFKSSAPFVYKIWYLIYMPLRKVKAFFSRKPSALQLRRAFRDFKNI